MATRTSERKKGSSLLEPDTEFTHPSSRHAWYHEKGKPELAEEEKNCHFCQIRKFRVRVENHVNLAIVNSTGDCTWIPSDFKFIDKSVLGTGVADKMSGREFQTGCSCDSDADCAKDECGCLDDLDDSTIINPDYKNAYYSSGKRKGLLRQELLELSSDEIYECSDLCNCSKDCPNRVVGRGRQFDLEVFKTDNGRGWGVRAREDLKQGQFIDKYVGEILVPAEAERRRQAGQRKAGTKDLYLFALDKFNDKNSHDDRLRKDPYEVDGEFMGGPTRFINHSCEPNLRIMAVVTDRANKHLHELCFFALEDISRFTELTFDYIAGIQTQEDANKVMDVEKELQDRQDQGKFTTKCLCGAAKCRGWLW